MAPLMSGQIDSFNRDGFLVVRDAIPGAVLDAFIAVLEAEVDRSAAAMFERGEIPDPYAGEPFATRWYRMWEDRGGEPKPPTWHACVFGPELYALWTHAAILDVVELVVGPEVQASGDYILRPKLPSLNLLPWHQDSGYMPATEQYPWPTVWVPFVPVHAGNGAMQFIPGSHRQPIQEHRKSGGAVYGTPARDPAAGREVVTPQMDPGDFVIFSNYVFHRSTAGGEPSVRWSIDFRFSPAGTPVGDHLWFHGMTHVVRSARDPGRIPGWDEVLALWGRSPQRVKSP